MHDRVIGPFIFSEGSIYYNMLELYLLPQLEEFQPTMIFQQDGILLHGVH